MAKGINIFGTLNGTLGETVYYRSGGEQKQRIRVRNPHNPNTNAQIVQRAKFSGAGMFFAHGKQALFPYAFESKRKNESNFNAFMRENISKAYPVSKDVKDSVSYPIFNSWTMSKGSLAPITTERAVGSSGEMDVVSAVIDVHKDFTLPTTIKELSSLLIQTGDYEDKDIITFLTISSDMISSQAEAYPEITPYAPATASWVVNQFNLDLANTNNLSMYGITCTKSSTAIVIKMSANPNVSVNSLGGFCCFHSRKTKSSTKVSTQVLILNEATGTAITLNAGSAPEWAECTQAVIDNYRGTINLTLEATEILQGSQSINAEFEDVGPNP